MARSLVQPSRSLFTVPVFLAPAFSSTATSCPAPRSFSSSSIALNQIPRGNRDKNKNRGVSAIRRTGPRHELSVTKLGPLPEPVKDPTERRAAFAVNPDHGLWGFFDKKEALIPPGEESSFGRPWSAQELSRKSWDDLHKLYWVCVKEVNVVRTRNNERRRLRAGYGEREGEDRLKVVRRTMHRIRQVILERHYSKFDAQLLLGEKFLHEIFPDVLQSHADLQDIGDEQSTIKSTQPEGDIVQDEFNTAGSPPSPDATNPGSREQRQRLAE